MSLEKPVFIFGAHKSGSSLIRSLLDGHRDLFVLPFEAHLFQYSGYWVDYSLRGARPAPLSLEEIRAAYIENCRHYNTISDPLSDANLTGQIDMERLVSEICSTPVSNLKDLIEAYFRASYAALLKSEVPGRVRFVEKSVEQAEYGLDLQKMFPDAKFIHLLRNPYSNLVALRRHLGRSNFPYLGKIIRSLYNSYYFLYRNRELLDHYLVLRYEDLLADPRAVMQCVAEFLTIPFDETLLTPTNLGSAWLGNSSRGLRFSGVSAKNLDLWRKDITPLEISLVNRAFPFVLDKFQYDLLPLSSSPYWPVKKERPIVYIQNRLFRLMYR